MHSWNFTIKSSTVWNKKRRKAFVEKFLLLLIEMTQIPQTKTKLFDKSCEHLLDNFDLKLSTNKCNSSFLPEKNKLGSNFLSVYSHFHLKNISDKLDEDNVDLHLTMSHFVSQIAHNQRELFINTINFVMNKERRRNYYSCPSCKNYPNTATNNKYETAESTT